MSNIHPFPATSPTPTREAEIETRWSHAGRKRIAGRYLKKTSLAPLQLAAQLPGRTLHLYLAIQHRCDLQRSQIMTLPSVYLRSWGLNKDAKSRALAQLEGAGLIALERRPGRPAVVTLL